MNREQAAEMHRHLRAAANAIRRAERIMWDLPQEDRAAFAHPLGNVVTALHYELLHQVIYRRFPDLKPPSREKPRIDSKLTWDQVRLPPSVTEADIDAIIFSVMKPVAQKVAMVLVRSMKQCEELALSISYEVLAARIRALADSGRIEGAGDLRMWRYSEVRVND